MLKNGATPMWQQRMSIGSRKLRRQMLPSETFIRPPLSVNHILNLLLEFVMLLTVSLLQIRKKPLLLFAMVEQ